MLMPPVSVTLVAIAVLSILLTLSWFISGLAYNRGAMPRAIDSPKTAEAALNSCERRSVKMKVLGTSAALAGAITLMLAIIIAQLNYQLSWGVGTVASTITISEPIPAVPERIAQTNR
jgi:Na+-transporting methylmalonyl-CoA/oxaloacetate decarboxylase gamma subunit